MKTKILLLLIAIPTTTVAQVVTVVDFKAVAEIMWWLFLADFLTGVAASYFVWKSSDRKDRWFFGKGEGFSSDKAKKCGIKAALYMGLPLLMVKFQAAFHLTNLQFDKFTTAQIDHPTVMVMSFCAIELFSIFNENLPKCGINIWRIVKWGLGLRKQIKEQL